METKCKSQGFKNLTRWTGYELVKPSNRREPSGSNFLHWVFFFNSLLGYWTMHSLMAQRPLVGTYKPRV